MKCKTCGTEHRGIPKHGGYCLDHQEQRAEAAEARAAELEVQLTGAAAVVVTLTKERDEARRELDAMKRTLSEAFNSGDGAYRP